MFPGGYSSYSVICPWFTTWALMYRVNPWAYYLVLCLVHIVLLYNLLPKTGKDSPTLHWYQADSHKCLGWCVCVCACASVCVCAIPRLILRQAVMPVNPGCSSSTQDSCCFQYRSRWSYGALICTCSFLSNARSHLVILRTKVWCDVLKFSASQSRTHPWFPPQWGGLWVSILDFSLSICQVLGSFSSCYSDAGFYFHLLQASLLTILTLWIVVKHGFLCFCGAKSCSDWLVSRRELLEAFHSCPRVDSLV